MTRIRSFKTEEEFYKKFLEYIDFCHENQKLPNVSGFSVFADINRDTFYEQKNKYTDTYKKIEDTLEDEAINFKGIGDARVIFYMKNKCGYKDKIETENENKNFERIQIVNDLNCEDAKN